MMAKDPTLENEQLMPIGGANLPVDVAPVLIVLGQVQVDHEIAELAEQDEIQAQAAASKTDAVNATDAVESPIMLLLRMKQTILSVKVYSRQLCTL